MYLYSNGNFYPHSLRSDYEKAGSWPQCGIDVPDEIATEFMATPPNGKIRGTDADGMPTWVNAPEPTFTYAQELTSLTAPYIADRDTLCAAWLRAAVADGTEETVRKEDVESEITELDAQYDADVAALKTKYGVS